MTTSTNPRESSTVEVTTSATSPVGAVVNFIGRYYIQWLLVIVVIVLALSNVSFRQAANVQNILLQSSFAGIAAAGMTLLIMCGAFDLSVAGLLGLCAVILVDLAPRIGVIPAVLVSLALGGFLGLLNGLVVTKFRIPAFIATLGMMNVYLTVGLVWTNSTAVPILDPGFRSLATQTFFGVVTLPFVVMIVVYFVAYAILHRTRYGRFIRAVGSNPIAAKTAGLPVDRVRIFAFVLVGLCTALAGVLLTSMLSSALAIMATGFELQVIAVVVVGGTSLAGGQGTLFGTITGAIFFAVINNALNMFGVAAYWQYVATGLILITALGIEALRRRFSGLARA
jgi:ribose transport system permease protein